MSRRIAMLLVATALSGCSYEYPVEAVFIDGRVTFLQQDDERTSAPWCMNSFKVADVDGTAMWEFDAYDAYRDATSCGPFFPMRYGHAPAGAKVIVAPRQLKPGRTYIISGDARGMFTGVFRYDERVQRTLTTYGRDSPAALSANERYWATQQLDSDAIDIANNPQ